MEARWQDEQLRLEVGALHHFSKATKAPAPTSPTAGKWLDPGPPEGPGPLCMWSHLGQASHCTGTVARAGAGRARAPVVPSGPSPGRGPRLCGGKVLPSHMREAVHRSPR